MSNLEEVKKYAVWLTNDCGGCETCSQIFTDNVYKEFELFKNRLTPEEMEQYINWEGAI